MIGWLRLCRVGDCSCHVGTLDFDDAMMTDHTLTKIQILMMASSPTNKLKASRPDAEGGEQLLTKYSSNHNIYCC